jgi:hypothetical protein
VAAGVSSFPAKPNPPTKIEAESSINSITLEWDASADTEMPVIGYVLRMNDGLGVDYSVIYNGVNFPNVRKYLVSGLSTGGTYTFTVEALNYNGAGEASDPAHFIICQKPSQFNAPSMTSVTRTEMTLNWEAPLSDGGCPITSYSLYSDDGAGGSFSEVDPAGINNLPTLRGYVRTFDPAETSKSFTYYLSATNAVGTSQTDTVAFILAAVPDKPTLTPV